MLEWLAVGLLTVPFGWQGAAAQMVRTDTPHEREIATLVQQLGSSRFAERERAAARLKELPDARHAMEALVKTSSDADRVERAKSILAELDKKQWIPVLNRFFDHPDRLPLDAAIGFLTQWPGPIESDDLWKCALGYASVLKKRGLGKQEYYAPVELASYTRTPFSTRKRITTEVREDSTVCALWKIDQATAGFRQLEWSVVLSRVPMHISGRAGVSVIVADSDLVVTNGQKLLIFTNGSVTLKGSHQNVVVLAGGEIDAREAMLMTAALSSRTRIRLRDEKPPSSVHILSEKESAAVRGLWSTPALLGLEITAQDDGLAVSRVAPGSLAAEAGILAGDLIRRVGDETLKGRSANDLMRDYWRAGPAGTCDFHMLREGRAVEAKLPVRPPAANGKVADPRGK